MRVISNSRNAKHYLVLQPSFSLNINEDNKKNRIYNYAFNKIMKSDFCTIRCINLSKFTKIKKEEIKNYTNNFSEKYMNEIFIDDAHLSDIGNKLLAEEISIKLNDN